MSAPFFFWPQRLPMTRSFLMIAFVTLIARGASAQLADPKDRREALNHYRTGQQLLMAEQWAKAAEEFTESIKLDYLLTLAHYGLGQAYMGMRDYNAAVRAFTQCKEAHHRLAQLQDSNRVAVERMQEEELRELRDSLQLIQSGSIKGVNPVTLQQLQNRIRDLEKGDGSAIARSRRRRRPKCPSLSAAAHFRRRGDVGDAEREYRAAIEDQSGNGRSAQ